eukprot:COSAG06_NODE_63517_length_262_cov_0.631902_1_plen_20_part_01
MLSQNLLISVSGGSKKYVHR